jgi:hypothetical protein
MDRRHDSASGTGISGRGTPEITRSCARRRARAYFAGSENLRP